MTILRPDDTGSDVGVARTTVAGVRNVSLGMCAVRAVMTPDLHGEVSASDRKRPLLTGVNGPLMARPSSLNLPDPVPGSPISIAAIPSGRGRRGKAREGTACSSALTLGPEVHRWSVRRLALWMQP